MLVYLGFTIAGFMAFFGAIVFYEHGGDALEVFFACVAGIIGVVLGQGVALLRFRTWVVAVTCMISGFFAFTLVSAGAMAGVSLPREIVPAAFFFAFAFPCGVLSLQHRWELFASFWPSVGFIGGVFIILNNEGRVHEWEEHKVSAWLPVPLFFLGSFLVVWLFYLAAKQSMRVELWQALSGAASRRVAKKASVSVVPRRNIWPMLVAAAALFGITAVLAPYLWRTGKGDRPSKHQHQSEDHSEDNGEPRQGPKVDGEAIMRQMRQMAKAAQDTAVKLWPLLLLFVLYRPAKRALLRTHLLTPIVPTPPTERIDNLWEYVRISAEDAGVIPVSSDSVEQLLSRIEEKGAGGPGIEEAAAIYVRTRYGFTVAMGDTQKMREAAVLADKELCARLTVWDRVRNLWRPLS